MKNKKVIAYEVGDFVRFNRNALVGGKNPPRTFQTGEIVEKGKNGMHCTHIACERANQTGIDVRVRMLQTGEVFHVWACVLDSL